jgi:hypothetical protein
MDEASLLGQFSFSMVQPASSFSAISELYTSDGRSVGTLSDACARSLPGNPAPLPAAQACAIVSHAG